MSNCWLFCNVLHLCAVLRFFRDLLYNDGAIELRYPPMIVHPNYYSTIDRSVLVCFNNIHRKTSKLCDVNYSLLFLLFVLFRCNYLVLSSTEVFALNKCVELKRSGSWYIARFRVPLGSVLVKQSENECSTCLFWFPKVNLVFDKSVLIISEKDLRNVILLVTKLLSTYLSQICGLMSLTKMFDSMRLQSGTSGFPLPLCLCNVTSGVNEVESKHIFRDFVRLLLLIFYWTSLF